MAANEFVMIYHQLAAVEEKEIEAIITRLFESKRKIEGLIDMAVKIQQENRIVQNILCDENL